LTTDPDARLQKLIRRLKSPHDLKRIHAGLLLGRMGAEARAAVPTLLQLLREESAQDRRLAAWTLGSIGQGAVEAIPALLVALRDSNEGVRQMACEALEKINLKYRLARAARYWYWSKTDQQDVTLEFLDDVDTRKLTAYLNNRAGKRLRFAAKDDNSMRLEKAAEECGYLISALSSS
jgi:hypothetical protein